MFKYGHLILESRAVDRITYLQRPEYRHSLSDRSVNSLNSYRESQTEKFKAAIVIVDGFSSTAVQAHANEMPETLCNLMEEKAQSLASSALCNRAALRLVGQSNQFPC